MRGIAVFACSWALAGCMSASASSVVKARAAHDFSCDAKQVTIENISGGTYAAKGCGQERTYDCVGSREIGVGYTCAPE